MSVSVIIPLYNKAPFVERALASVLAQSAGDFEVLVVNDGSTDDGPALVANCRDPRVRLIHQSNAGPGAARNRGLEEAVGEYVAFLDADDEWLPTYLEQSLALLDRYGPEVASVSSGYVHYPAGRSAAALWRRRGLRDGVYHVDATVPPQFVVHLLAYLTPCTTVARTASVRRWGGFYTRDRCVYGEDAYLWLKVLLNEPVAVSLEPRVAIHSEASALSRQTRGPRPIEPLLLDPAGLYAACPDELRILLDRVLAVRALRTACMLSYWGRWRAGRSLLQQYCPWSSWRLPRFGLTQLCATPLGAAAGAVCRLWQRSRMGPSPA